MRTGAECTPFHCSWSHTGYFVLWEHGVQSGPTQGQQVSRCVSGPAITVAVWCSTFCVSARALAKDGVAVRHVDVGVRLASRRLLLSQNSEGEWLEDGRRPGALRRARSDCADALPPISVRGPSHTTTPTHHPHTYALHNGIHLAYPRTNLQLRVHVSSAPDAFSLMTSCPCTLNFRHLPLAGLHQPYVDGEQSIRTR